MHDNSSVVDSNHFLNPGQPGCRNIRDGGETIKPDETGPFLVYLVYRSFQRRPTSSK